jgi:hypothetical protein
MIKKVKQKHVKRKRNLDEEINFGEYVGNTIKQVIEVDWLYIYSLTSKAAKNRMVLNEEAQKYLNYHAELYK